MTSLLLETARLTNAQADAQADAQIDAQADELSRLRTELASFEARAASVRSRPPLDWRLVVNTSLDAYFAADLTGEVMEWSERAESLFGWTSHEAIGRPLSQTIFPANEQKGDVGGLRHLIEAGAHGGRMETTARRKDGTEIPIEVSAAPMKYGSSFVFNAFVHDVTKRRALQAQLAHAQKLESVGQLASGIAHEINTPTQYVGDNTRFARDAIEDLFTVLDAYLAVADRVRAGEDATEALAAAERATEDADLDYLTTELRDAVAQSLEGVARVTAIVRAMKEFSHPGTSAKSPADLNHAIENTLTVATNEWKYVAVIETDFDPALPKVPCLVGDVNQVLLNLIVNAAQAIAETDAVRSGGRGVIRVSTRLAEPYAEVRISDTGCGIPESIAGRVFDPFFTTKEVGVGSGQGLAIARNVIVDKHGGSIAFEPNPAGGTTFILRLPLCP